MFMTKLCLKDSGVSCRIGVTMGITTFCSNRKARHEYHIIDTIEAGIALKGTEIKSIRNGKITLDGAYARVIDGEVFLVDCDIQPYENGTIYNHEPKRPRKLLLHKREVSKFAEKAEQQGSTLIPLSVYQKNGMAKVELAIATGKKLHDKRESLKKRDAEREMRNHGRSG